ncbi:hypothetical protein [Mesorhizobium sp. M0633]|uniref:hypothetical protein n=1 Tax=Mesorhizobium sp. M0633 TaxID=2956977 RepID=UPI0033395E00
MNPFLRRATEYLRDTASFLQITSPEPLNTFIASHKRVHDLLDVPVRVIGSPGTGKTMMASLVEFRLVEAVLMDQSTAGNRALAAALTDAQFADGERPKVVAIRIPMESEYRDFWELPYDAAIKTKLMLGLIQARAVLGLFRTLTTNGYRDVDGIEVATKSDKDAQAARIGGPTSRGMRERARLVEEVIYGIGASLIPPELSDIPELAQAPYQPFESIRELEIDWKGERLRLRPLVILDDVHSLHPEQYAALFRALTRREIKIGRWMMMRMDSLSPSAVFRSTDEDALPGLKHDRDYLDIVMEGSRNGDRKQFRKMANDMANRYLLLVDPLRERGHQTFRGLLSTQPPTLSDARQGELMKLLDRDQAGLSIAASRRARLEEVVHRYSQGTRAIDRGKDVEAAMTRVLMHRYAGRVQGQTLSLFDDPEPPTPVKAKSQILDAARVHLNHLYDRPLHFGLDDLCDAADENAELFLQLAGELVSRMETKVIRGQDPTLTPAQQADVLQAKGADIIEKWLFPYARKVKALVEGLAAQCVENATLPNAPLGGGANSIGVLESEMQQLLKDGGELPAVLKYALAYGALSAVRDYGQGNKLWCLLELSGPVCLKYGLDLGRGNFLERTAKELAGLIEEDE